ncbi:MAG TPA: hypothetical protein VK601_22885, partial [Kofleriaceae bacterium]|nr:hypothetical protein [Kofleriaceae bacterium]
MARIAFHMSPEFSHLAPTYRLAKQLLDRGHQVSYLQPPDFADEIRAQGLGFAPIFEHIYPRGLHEVLDAMDRDARVAATRALEVALCASYERGHAEPALRAAAPDLLLVDPLQVPMSFVAEKLGIRAALITPFMPQGHDPGVPRMFTPAQLPRTALGRLGVELGWRWFQDKRAVRRAIDRALMLAALASRPALDGVIVTGTPRWSATLPPPPPNVTLVRWARPLEILPGAALSITHGGLGSVKESL